MISAECSHRGALHAPPILPAHLEQRLGDLTERAYANGLHQLREYVAVLDHDTLESLERLRSGSSVPRVKLREPLELRLLLFLGRARELEFLRHRIAVRIAERVHSD